MSVHLEKVLAHAEKQLESAGRHKPTDLLHLYKRFLKIEEHRLRLKHGAGGGGREIARQRVDLLDIVLRHLYRGACGFLDKNRPAKSDKDSLAIVAIGGYGRGELNPGSDVDIMFLHNATGALSPYLNEVVEQVLYMLWDVGFKVGHSVRSVAEAVKQANQDNLSKTSLLESRYLAGDKQLVAQLHQRFQADCVHGQEKAYVQWRIEDQLSRHSKYSNTVFLQEPNIKNGCGGLRDYHNLLWVSFFKEGVITTSKLVEKKLMHETERRKLEQSYDFLLRVRTELHYLNKRPTDSLTLAFQGQIANRFNYPQKNILKRSEAFMRDYYQHTRNVFFITQTLFERLSLPFRKTGKPQIFSFLARGKKKTEHFDGFYSENGLIYPEQREIFHQDPHRLIRVFLYAQQRGLLLSPELQQMFSRRLRLVDRTFQYSKAARETFSAILSRKGEVGRILRMMHEVDFLGRYIPEFGRLTCLVQHEFFHRYTADEHTIVCIEMLDKLIDTKDDKLKDYRLIFQKLEDPFVLYLALLLHDTGKSSDMRNHADASTIFAQKVAARLQLSPDRRKSLLLLVDHHVTLSATSQRRSLDDIETIESFAQIIKNQTNLDALMLLTLADGQGTSADSWSDWKETLVWQLYRTTSRYLAEGQAFQREIKMERAELKQIVAKKMAKDFNDEIEAHFHYMPERYFRSNEANDIVGHLRLFRTFFENAYGNGSSLQPSIRWIPRPDQGHSEVWICTWNRKNLLAKLTGSFTVVPLNILSADIFTRDDNLVLDIFRVCDTNFDAVEDRNEMAMVERTIIQALADEDFDFGPLLAKARKRTTYHLAQELDFPTRILITNESSPHYTFVEIQSPDRLGFLYDMLHCFSEAGVSIALSRITTEKGAAIDSFYVTDAEGKQIGDPETLAKLQRMLEQAVGLKRN